MSTVPIQEISEEGDIDQHHVNAISSRLSKDRKMRRRRAKLINQWKQNITNRNQKYHQHVSLSHTSYGIIIRICALNP